jgi:hypothetical protein
MPDTKITALTAISTVDPAVDVLPIVDVSDTTMAASGTTKKITTNQILGAGGTATLASATVTGAATAARLIVTGSTIPANGVYLPAANTVGFAANSLDQYRIEPLGVFTWYDGAGGTRMTLNSTGLGVGVTPSAWSGYGAPVIQMPSGGTFVSSGSIAVASNFYYSGGQFKYIANSTASYYFQNSGQHIWYTAPSGIAGNNITFTQALTLTTSGDLLVGTTTTSGNAGGLKLSNVAGNLGQITFSNNSGSSDYVARFNWGSTPTLVGNITVSSGGTAFNTTSDYRLKESVQPLLGGLARVNALKPSVYKWKTDGSNGEGFLAHELAEVVPAAVTGDKDAVNEDGSIKPQGVDLSKVVPILVAAIKELTAEVNALKNA